MNKVFHKSPGLIHRRSVLLKSVVLALLMGVISVSTVYASEGHEPRWADFGWRVLNLIIFCGILWYFIGGLWKRFFRNRHDTISNTFSELEKRKADARDNLAEIEKRIANLEVERQAILAESAAQGDRLKKSIMADAQKQAEQIVEQARRTAENESRATLDQVREKVAAEIIEAATKSLKGQLTAEDHDKLIDKALDKVVLQ